MTDGSTSTAPSSYLEYLPAVFSENGGFLGRFLLAFEHVLTGVGDADDAGFEELLDGGPADRAGNVLSGAHRYFHPGLDETGELPDVQRAPTEFLTWLAGWVALTPRADMPEAALRTLIARAVPLYRIRGTKEGISQLLQIYGINASIDEPLGWFQIGRSRVGVDTNLGGVHPFFFSVTANVASSDPNVVRYWSSLARAILDAEKPAHTYYDFQPQVIQLEIGKVSTIGVDTLLG